MSIQTNLQETSPSVILRQAFSVFPTGVVAVCSLGGDGPVGMAVNSFISVSLDPPLVAISVARTSSTWPALLARPRIGLSVLGSQHGEVCRRLASRGRDRFENVDWHSTADGAVHIDDAALWLECSVHSTLDGGDHEIILLEVLTTEVFPDVAPLVFHQSQFRGLKSGQ